MTLQCPASKSFAQYQAFETSPLFLQINRLGFRDVTKSFAQCFQRIKQLVFCKIIGCKAKEIFCPQRTNVREDQNIVPFNAADDCFAED